MSDPGADIVEPQQAASVVLLRDTDTGPEILYLRRNPDLRFMGGYWVFPGGRIDAADQATGVEADTYGVARRAAAREALEEAGVQLDPAALRPLCRWTTPTSSPIRFATWFFAVSCDPDTVSVDGIEILDHQWRRPEDALRAHQAGGLQFANPTFALSTRLAGHASVSETFAAIATWPMEQLLGRIQRVDGGRVALYAEDCGYETGQTDCEGPRHRIWMLDTGWRYEREF
jgi:8-oxo-dGTP pyrophosphatase MutT (NUDIX family)